MKRLDADQFHRDDIHGMAHQVKELMKNNRYRVDITGPPTTMANHHNMLSKKKSVLTRQTFLVKNFMPGKGMKGIFPPAAQMAFFKIDSSRTIRCWLSIPPYV
jgi:hypothetical protein